MARTNRPQDDEVLYGWKAIAICLDCSTRTAQRLEKSEGLPILRPDKRQKGRVLAIKRSLLAWMTGGIESVVLTENRLIAFNRRTRVLWSYEFTTSLPNYDPEELAWRIHIVDLEGKGERGVLFAARFQSPAVLDTVFYFSSEGKVLWQLEADPPLRNRDGDPFERDWKFKHIALTHSTTGYLVWAALANHAGWAGCVLRIDAGGSANIHFANAGYVESICPVNSKSNSLLVVCGENNDFDDAFVALLRPDDPPSSSISGERLVYRFANAPTGKPRTYIRFPKTEVIQARQKPYGHATRIAPHMDGIVVEVETGGNGSHFRYHFSNDLEPRYVFPSGSHEFCHREFEARGVITHDWLNCPELQSPLVLRTWEPDSEWYDQPVPWRDNPWKEIDDTHVVVPVSPSRD